ncbi:MAG: bifunctional [glutamine synthetase] adenylyltransferase/[glutamine synthetase]-adenylyl-L-tyrosine phosphorylase [Janthinobacterium lividum]
MHTDFPAAGPADAWPQPADPDAGTRLLERFAEQGQEPLALTLRQAGAAMLMAVGGGSPYLSDLTVREHACVTAFARHGPDVVVADAMRTLAETGPDATRAQVMRAMRVAKRRVSLVTALADIGSLWTLPRVTAALSDVAEATLRLAVAHLVLAAHRSGALVLPDPGAPERDCGLIVLGMGKLGARELNYSSDIDLVMLYDPEAHPAADTLGATFTRIARALVAMMETRDADGYVFRTDLRLRPDPAATPPAVALPAAIAYYESLGQNWERAAMTKARPVAGDLPRGDGFLAAIRPFVWRRHLDFAAIADLHAMKRRIDTHRGFSVAGLADGLAGYDVKLGPGGIREIEFAAQTLQLVWGGRDPALRDPTTLGALRRLVRAGHMTRRGAAELTLAYRLLRRVEHRLQMVADRQTHLLPERADELARFAVFLGCRTEAELAALLGTHMARVRARYAEVFETVPDPGPEVPPLDLAGRDAPAATVDRLLGMGFRNTAGMIATLRGWKAGRVRALRSARARELMDTVLPGLLAALGQQADPDATFVRFDAMLSRQPAGVQLLSMMQRHPDLLARVAAVLGAAPSLADHLALVPSALEGLLTPAHAPAAPPATLLTRRLADARSLEDVVGVTSGLVRAEEFRLCCAQMEGAIDVDQAGYERTGLADAALQALLPVVLAEHARRYGWVLGGDMAVVALGKAGSEEMMAGSDLDLMLLYTHPPGVLESDGAKTLPTSQWFIRAAHAFVAAMTAPGAEGPLYAVDMRLRPSGNKGPVAVPLSGFTRYHATEAWTWERMTLTRARVVAGNPAIRRRAEAAIAGALATPVDPARTLADAVDMRRRLLRELPPAGSWDVKMRPGGGMEVEFIAQVLQLLHGIVPGGQNTGRALRALAARGVLPATEATELIEADLLWRTVQSMRRITVGRGSNMPDPAMAALLRAVAAVTDTGLDRTGLDATLERTAQQVRAIFNRRIGVIE